MAQATKWTWATAYRVPDWLLSDTEESVLGTEWHQETIGAFAEMLREVMRRYRVTWGVCEQIALQGLQHESGTAYDPHPDLMVLARPLPDGNIASVSLDDFGAPLFVMEVASASTGKNDLGEKRLAYEAIGVPEYIVYDPYGSVLRAPLRAWRLQSGAYVQWRPDVRGWWHSASLDMSFRATQPFLTIRDRDGRQVGLAREAREHGAHLEQRLGEAEQARAEAEQARAEEARRRVEAEQARAELEEELRRLRERSGE